MKKVKANNSTQAIALEFAKRACEAINKQLAVEIPRLGFSIDDLNKGKTKLVREVKVSETDDRFIGESFVIESGKIRRIVLSVRWSPNGFEIQRYNQAIANSIKASPNFKIQKNTSALVTGNMSEREIDIEARANQYMIEDLKKNANLTIK